MPTADPRHAPGSARVARIVAVVILLTLIVTAAGLLIFTERGNVLLHHPKQMRQTVVSLVQAHRLIAPFAYMVLYAVLGCLALPVWWLQVLGGMAFGLLPGIAYSQFASVGSAVVAARFSHWLAADWMHRIESKLHRLQSLDQTFGNNGLLVVMAVRLTHVLPFGLSNYAFGLTTVRPRDIAWGTLLGGLPAAAVYVAIGVGDHPLADWRYIVGIVVLNVLLLLPLAIRYLKS